MLGSGLRTKFLWAPGSTAKKVSGLQSVKWSGSGLHSRNFRAPGLQGAPLWDPDLNNTKNTWNRINSLINNNRKKSKVVSSLKHLNDNSTTKDLLEISYIFNRYFTSVGHNLATQVPNSSHRFNKYLSSNNNFGSFFFDPVSPENIEREMLSIPKNKSYGLYSCPIRILSYAKHILSGPPADIFNMSVQKGVFPSKLKEAKVIPVYKR